MSGLAVAAAAGAARDGAAVDTEPPWQLRPRFGGGGFACLRVHRVLSLILALAVKDGRLVRNPAAGVNLPRVVKDERRYLTHVQVDELAGACGPYRLLVPFLAYTSVRWGEMAALRVGRVDLLRRRAMVAESVTLVRGAQTWGTPKGHERRSVPIPQFLADELAAHVAGKARDELVFPGEKGGGALRAQVFQRSPMPPTRSIFRVCTRTR